MGKFSQNLDAELKRISSEWQLLEGQRASTTEVLMACAACLSSRELSVILKWDGGRENHKITVLVSGPPLGEQTLRCDGDVLEMVLGRVIVDAFKHLERFSTR